MRFNIQFKMLVGYLLVVLLVSAGSWWSARLLRQTWADQAALADVRWAEESLHAFTGISGRLETLEDFRQKSLYFERRSNDDQDGLVPGVDNDQGGWESENELSYARSFKEVADVIQQQLTELRPILRGVDDSVRMSEMWAQRDTPKLSNVLLYIEGDFIEYRRRFRRALDSPPTEAGAVPELSGHPLVVSIILRIYKGLVEPVEVAQLHFKDAANRRKVKAEELTAMLPLVPGLIAMLLSVLITRRVANPIRELRRATERIAAGDFTRPIQVRSDDEVGDLARAMNRMSRRLAELDEMKSGFLFNVSHELKTPLTSIKEAAALLQEEVPGTVNDKQQRLLEIISAETRILIGMIIDLLDLARMEAGRMGYKFERTSLGAIVRRSVDQLQFMAQRRGVTLTVDEAPQLGNFILDGDKLVNAVKNLVGNAVKFSHRGGEVVIRTGLGPPSVEPLGEGEAFWSTSGADRPDRVRTPSALISVSDRGPGIPEKDLPLIFEKFYQSERRSDSKVKGTGLGLAIVRHVVEAHGGSVAVRSAPASGSTFTISLPLPAGTGLREPAYRRRSVAPLEVKHDAV